MMIPQLNKQDKVRLIYLIIITLLVFSSIKLLNNNKFFNSKTIKTSSTNKNFISKKWIVVTSISEPTDQCKKLSKINGFKLLVIGDKKSPSNWILENTIFLSVSDQKNLQFKTFSTTPLNSYTRKNIGYLYAILNGAEFIYDTDDDNAPTIDLDKYFNFNDTEYGLIYDCQISERIINPYAHFGQPQIWPRGYPLNGIKNIYNNSYVSGIRKMSLVQQGVVNGDPDVDAIFRLTKSMQYRKIDLYFDSSSPSFQIPLYKMSPYNSQNTLISYAGFWSLYLPQSVEFRLTDIWRSYWAQRLMWLINETISFSGPNAYQMRNAHNYLNDFEQEKSMYLKTEKLIDFLFDWKCVHSSFYACMIQLTADMASQEFWAKSEIKSVKNWIDDLILVGYVEPRIINFENKHLEMLKCEQKIGTFDYTRIRYTPNFQKSIESLNFETVPNEMESKAQYFTKFCKDVGVNLNKTKNNEKPLKFNITILVTFNRNAYEDNIIILDKLYKHHFQNVIFCGSNIINKLNSYKGKSKKFDSFTFIEMVDFGIGGYHYFCASKVIEMGLKTEGIFLQSDDVLLKFWNLNNLDTKKVWFPTDLILNIKMRPNEVKNWMHWPNINKIIKMWSDFDVVLQKSKNSKEIKYIKSFLNQIKQNQDRIENITKVKYCGSDFFYLPSDKFEIGYYFLNKFRKYDVFLELAVPIVLAGIESNKTLQIMNGHYEWGGAPLRFHQMYSKINFFHPFKLSKLKQKETASNYCLYFVNDYINDSL